ncbi:hypothetical protein ACJX0J_007530, partial [Zea mays]
SHPVCVGSIIITTTWVPIITKRDYQFCLCLRRSVDDGCYEISLQVCMDSNHCTVLLYMLQL